LPSHNWYFTVLLLRYTSLYKSAYGIDAVGEWQNINLSDAQRKHTADKAIWVNFNGTMAKWPVYEKQTTNNINFMSVKSHSQPIYTLRLGFDSV